MGEASVATRSRASAHFTCCEIQNARTMCSIHLIQYGRRKRILRHGPSLNNSAPPINTRASASRSHSATRNSKGSKSSRRSKPRIRPHSGCSTLGIAAGALVRHGRTEAIMPCACFRDHRMSADLSKSHCENTVFISVLNWTIFDSSEQACGDETALVDVPARWESRDENRQQLRGASHEFVLHCCSR